MPRIAAIQMTSQSDVDQNLNLAKHYVTLAADQGADCVVLPENFAFIGKSETDKVNMAEEPGSGAIQSFLEAQSRTVGIWIIAGTIPIKSDDPDKVLARTLVYNTDGKCIAHYDKIHLFDVTVGGGKEVYCESDATIAGQNPVVIKTPFGNLGLAVCYDLRFPELFRLLLSKSADVFILPAAFTKTTGQAHWEVLLRARAIENLSYLIASAQWGTHNGLRQTYGHSMIISPWGKVLDCLESGNGIVISDIDREALQRVRQEFPALMHRCLSC